MHGYKDTNVLADDCQKVIVRLMEEERLEAETARSNEMARKVKRGIIITTVVMALSIAIVVGYIVVTKGIIPNDNYNNALALMSSGEYMKAIEEFESLNGYKDSVEKINDCNAAMAEECYKNAVECMEAEDYLTAYELFDDLNGYKDSEKLKDSIEDKCENVKLARVDIGEVLLFGDYYGNSEWIVLDKDCEKILVITKDAIELMPYNEEGTQVTWETCTLRRWLNETYFLCAFNSDERAMILESQIVNVNNPNYSTNGGNDTIDKVFLLSIDEVNRYFPSANDRIVTFSKKKYVSWWLRSPGADNLNAASVAVGGGLGNNYGLDVTYDNIGVRPALWIDISKFN